MRSQWNLAPVVLFIGALPAVASPVGHIAGVQHDRGIVYSAATGQTTKLPHARRPMNVFLSPDSQWALYFSSTRPKPSDDGDDSPFAGFVSRAPFQAATAMAPPLASFPGASSVTWLPQHIAAIEGYNLHALYNPAKNDLLKSGRPIETASSDGSVTAYTTDTAIYVRTSAWTPPKVIFDTKKPAALVRALSRAHFPKDGNGFEYDAELAKDQRNWMFTSPRLTSDGKALYFCTNGGSGEGAQGNTTFFVVKADVATGKLTALDRLGLFFGRSPSTFELSPDQRHILISSSAHASAADNSFVVTASDINTGHMVNLLEDHKDKKAYANLVKGACWSPDSRYIAVSIFYYNPDTADAAELYDKSVAHLELKEAATGKTVRTISDFAWPNWAR